jgi:hypothetical protein
MNTQQKIEKIREIVIMKNNPECETYEEALENEEKQDARELPCLYILTDNDNCVVNRDYIAKYYHHNNNYKILGLPLNLERLLIALNNIDDHSYYSFGTGNIYCSEEDWSCTWQPNKLLEEQSDGTIEKIYNILF